MHDKCQAVIRYMVHNLYEKWLDMKLMKLMQPNFNGALTIISLVKEYMVTACNVG